jgi:hypothetical protein
MTIRVDCVIELGVGDVATRVRRACFAVHDTVERTDIAREASASRSL